MILWHLWSRSANSFCLSGLSWVSRSLTSRVGGSGFGNVGDGGKVGGNFLQVNLPTFGFAVVVRDEKTGTDVLRVVRALRVGGLVNGDVIGFTFDYGERDILGGFVGGGAPYHDVGTGIAGTAPSDGNFFAHLFGGVAVFVDEVADVFLAHGFFGGFDKPCFAKGAVDFAFGFVALGFRAV